MESSTAAAGLLRRARREAGLTQVELARRAGVARSVISAYESGRRQPTVPTLMELIGATGRELSMTLREPDDVTNRMTGPVGHIVRQRRQALVRAAARHGVRGLLVFGSVARGGDRPDSDLDLMVDLPAATGLFALGRLRQDLESVLDGLAVDVVPVSDLKPDVRRRVEREAIPL